MSKIYTSEETAKKMAEKTGKTMVAVSGGWQLMTTDEAAKHQAQPVEEVVAQEEPIEVGPGAMEEMKKSSKSFSLKNKKAQDASGNDVVKAVLKGAKETKVYIITPNIGGFKNRDSRWFEKAQLNGWSKTEGGIEITCPRHVLSSRGLASLGKAA